MTRIARAGTLLALALITTLALAGPAGAKKKGPHRHAKHGHQLPKGWAKHAKVKGAKGDPDADGLTNWGEFRSHTRPRRTDSDHDGTGDALEDYDRDGLDNGSEEDARTDPGVKDTDRDGVTDANEDADHDRLSNAVEDRTGTNLRDSDSDDDGIRDGDEIAGTVVSYDGETLTLRLPNGKLLSGTVDADTEFGCWSRDDDFSSPVPSGDDPADDGSDDGADEDAHPGDVLTAHLSQDDGGSGAACDDGLLDPGAVVHEAELEDAGDGAVFVTIDLIDS